MLYKYKPIMELKALTYLITKEEGELIDSDKSQNEVICVTNLCVVF